MEHSITIPVTNNRKVRILLGIDEAGRGSLVGNMFVVGVCVSEDKIGLLENIGVRDSKTLTPQRRQELYTIIKTLVKAIIVEQIPPQRIDYENLNELFLEAVSKIVARAISICKTIDAIYIDLTGSKHKLIESIRKVGFKGEIIAEHHADRKYIIVSTASIVAKVLRDQHIKELSEIYGDIGSGYPSDPKTIKWLLSIASEKSLPPIVRRSWGTIKRYLPQVHIDKKISKARFRKLDEYLS